MSAHILIKTCILFLTALNVKRPLVFSGERLKLLRASSDTLFSFSSPLLVSGTLVFSRSCWSW